MEITGFDNKYMVYGMLFAVSNRIQTFGDEQFEDITMRQHFMMIVLGLFGGKSPTLKELADAVGCSYQNIKRMAANLEKNKYVTIVEDDMDKRKRHIVMTDKLRRMGEDNMKMTQTFMEGLYSGISDEELGSVVKVLKKMEKNITNMGGAGKE
ncbi:MAG: MarR family transcriptional regulator [Clostridiales bacterium]|jgi:DNA-binding MarR family transcriptional regulator|nr:MarR family transcriptional regulator [Clostridiales bacterium]